MKIEKVEYRRLVSDGNFNNESHGAVAIVEDGEDPVCAHADLIAWVDEMLRKRGYLREAEHELHNDLNRLEQRHGQLSYDVDKLERKSKKMLEFLKAHGVEIRDDELPF